MGNVPTTSSEVVFVNDVGPHISQDFAWPAFCYVENTHNFSKITKWGGNYATALFSPSYKIYSDGREVVDAIWDCLLTIGYGGPQDTVSCKMWDPYRKFYFLNTNINLRRQGDGYTKVIYSINDFNSNIQLRENRIRDYFSISYFDKRSNRL